MTLDKFAITISVISMVLIPSIMVLITGVHTDPRPVYAVHVVYDHYIIASYTQADKNTSDIPLGYKVIINKIAE